MAKSSLTARHLSSNKEVQIITTLSAGMAHELRNYLATVNLCAELSAIQLSKMKTILKSAEYLLSNLMSQIKGLASGVLDTKDFKFYSIAKNINEALEQYPFKENERELISLDLNEDFEYRGNQALTTQMLFNLIKNALRAIKNTEKGSIVIRLEFGAKFNKLIFRDTASGIAKEFLPKMFKLFESQMTAQDGTGVGLAFCKTIMASYGGDITCDSVEREYTDAANHGEPKAKVSSPR
jgi:Signal transduction histidine kinase